MRFRNTDNFQDCFLSFKAQQEIKDALESPFEKRAELRWRRGTSIEMHDRETNHAISYWAAQAITSIKGGNPAVDFSNRLVLSCTLGLMKAGEER